MPGEGLGRDYAVPALSGGMSGAFKPPYTPLWRTILPQICGFAYPQNLTKNRRWGLWKVTNQPAGMSLSGSWFPKLDALAASKVMPPSLWSLFAIVR